MKGASNELGAIESGVAARLFDLKLSLLFGALCAGGLVALIARRPGMEELKGRALTEA